VAFAALAYSVAQDVNGDGVRDPLADVLSRGTPQEMRDEIERLRQARAMPTGGREARAKAGGAGAAGAAAFDRAAAAAAAANPLARSGTTAWPPPELAGWLTGQPAGWLLSKNRRSMKIRNNDDDCLIAWSKSVPAPIQLLPFLFLKTAFSSLFFLNFTSSVGPTMISPLFQPSS